MTETLIPPADGLGIFGHTSRGVPLPADEGTGRTLRRQAPLDLVKLGPVMERTAGRPEVVIGLIDGPVALGHPGLAGENIREITARTGRCSTDANAGCFHGTFVAGILSAKRGSSAPALCPNCTLVVRPIFPETDEPTLRLPAATPRELSAAVLECIEAGARILNLSAALTQASPRDERDLTAVLDYASQRGVVLVAAAGNQSLVGGSVITRHPAVLPVVGYSLAGWPTTQSNLGAAIGKQGLGSPGEGVTSLRPGGGTAIGGGTSVAAPFVTGAIGLLLSAFPRATATHVRSVLTRVAQCRRRTVVPPLLDALSGYWALSQANPRR